ncbi:MAG: hypothetical protein ACYDEV_08720 [Acidiferrobacter sp.]
MGREFLVVVAFWARAYVVTAGSGAGLISLPRLLTSYVLARATHKVAGVGSGVGARARYGHSNARESRCTVLLLCPGIEVL